MLFIGMGTEVVVFFLSAFDRPFDKTKLARICRTITKLTKKLPNISASNDEADAKIEDENEAKADDKTAVPAQSPAAPTQMPAAQGGVVFVGQGIAATAAAQPAARATTPVQTSETRSTAYNGSSCCRSHCSTHTAGRGAFRKRSTAIGRNHPIGQRRTAAPSTGCSVARNGNGYAGIHRKTTRTGRYLPKGRRTERTSGTRQRRNGKLEPYAHGYQ